MAKFNYAIQLNDNTVIYKIGYGIILNEPNIIAVKQKGKKTEIEAVGNDAMNLIGKTSDSTEIIEPLKENAVVNRGYAIQLIKEFVKKIKEPFEIMNCILLTSDGLSLKEKSDLLNVMYGAGFKEVQTFSSCLAGLLQMETDIYNCNASMLVNLSNLTEISVVGNGELIQGCTIDIGSNMIDIAIKQYVYDNYNGLISIYQANEVRNEISTLLANDVSKTSIIANEVNGFGTFEVVLNSQEIRGIITDAFNKICGTIEGILSLCSPQVIEDIKRKGIYLCGELCNITGIERYMKGKLNMAVYCDNEPGDTIILGGGVVLNNPKLIYDFAVKK